MLKTSSSTVPPPSAAPAALASAHSDLHSQNVDTRVAAQEYAAEVPPSRGAAGALPGRTRSVGAYRRHRWLDRPRRAACHGLLAGAGLFEASRLLIAHCDSAAMAPR